MKRPQHPSSSRCAPRVVLFGLTLALAGCADLGFPTEPAYYIGDASGGCSAGASRAEARGGANREERRVERARCSGPTPGGGGRQPAKK